MTTDMGTLSLIAFNVTNCVLNPNIGHIKSPLSPAMSQGSGAGVSFDWCITGRTTPTNQFEDVNCIDCS